MAVPNSILTETKRVIGFEEDYDHYDLDIIMHINSAFATLNQLGVGPKKTFLITTKNSQWSEFTQDDDLVSVKSYIWASVRLAFDPPSTSYAITALETMKKELEWRLNVVAEGKEHAGSSN